MGEDTKSYPVEQRMLIDGEGNASLEIKARSERGELVRTVIVKLAEPASAAATGVAPVPEKGADGGGEKPPSETGADGAEARRVGGGNAGEGGEPKE